MSNICSKRPGRLLARLALLACIGSVDVTNIAVANDAFGSLQVENDLFGSGNDRFYTNGLEVSRLTTGSPPSWLAKTTDHLPFFRLGDAQAVQFSLGSRSNPAGICSLVPRAVQSRATCPRWQHLHRQPQRRQEAVSRGSAIRSGLSKSRGTRRGEQHMA